MCGCFKVRETLNIVSALSREARDKGLITASSRNHGTALFLRRFSFWKTTGYSICS